MASMIEQAKQIPASAIAERYGIHLKKSGLRYWASCPFHHDRHASLCFYPGGTWYCFSCHRGGDSVALLANLEGLTMGEAAREICAGFHASAPADPAIRNAYRWREERIKQLRRVVKLADKCTCQYSTANAETAWTDRLFAAAILAKAQALCEIDQLDAASETELNQFIQG